MDIDHQRIELGGRNELERRIAQPGSPDSVERKIERFWRGRRFLFLKLGCQYEWDCMSNRPLSFNVTSCGQVSA